MIGRTNILPGGATLEVEGVSRTVVSITNGSITKTKQFGDNNTVTFVGLEDGVWEITMTDGDDSVTTSQEIKTSFSANVQFFNAIIDVTYPIGSICKCSKGAKVYTSNNSGRYQFNVTEPGIWNISYILNEFEEDEETVSYNVEVTVNGSTVKVPTVNVLYDAGAFSNGFEHSVVTSGLTATVTEQTDYIKIDNSKGTNSGYVCIGAVYFGGVIHANITGATNYSIPIVIGISSKKDSEDFIDSFTKTFGKNEQSEITFDTSGYYGKGYIYIGTAVEKYTSARSDTRITKIWMT